MSKFCMRRHYVGMIASVATVLMASQVLAAGTGSHGHGGAMMTGQPAKASAADRTVTVTMHDNYYEPENLSFKEGETVHIIVKNEGSFVHEFNIATAAMHKAHAPEMMMMVEHGVLEPDKINWDAAKKMQASMGHGMHNEPNSVLLEPGKSGEIVWTFPAHADLEFACNIPGHYDESGMMGPSKIK